MRGTNPPAIFRGPAVFLTINLIIVTELPNYGAFASGLDPTIGKIQETSD